MTTPDFGLARSKFTGVESSRSGNHEAQIWQTITRAVYALTRDPVLQNAFKTLDEAYLRVTFQRITEHLSRPPSDWQRTEWHSFFTIEMAATENIRDGQTTTANIFQYVRAHFGQPTTPNFSGLRPANAPELIQYSGSTQTSLMNLVRFVPAARFDEQDPEHTASLTPQNLFIIIGLLTRAVCYDRLMKEGLIERTSMAEAYERLIPQINHIIDMIPEGEFRELVLRLIDSIGYKYEFYHHRKT